MNNNSNSPPSQFSTPPPPSSNSGNNTDMARIIATGVITLIIGLMIGYFLFGSSDTGDDTGSTNIENTSTETSSALPTDISNEWYTDIQGQLAAITNDTITINPYNNENPDQPLPQITVMLGLQQNENTSPVRIVYFRADDGNIDREEDASIGAIQVNDDIGLTVSVMEGQSPKITQVLIYKVIGQNEPPATDTSGESPLPPEPSPAL